MRIDTDILDRFVRKVYRGFDTAGEVEPDIWREVLRVINEATVEGLAMAPEPPAHDRMFYQTLRRSNEVFAAFKVHMMGEDMAAKLIDADGNLKPFDRWRRDIASIASHQVGSWLRTEYDTAVIRAHAAADWREFERNKDILPNLRWMPTTSPEPEGSHRRFWEARLTLPVDDPFWNDHHPGDRWNCKCSLEATDEPVCRPDDLEPATPHRGLENNPGKDGHTFSDNHPYFPKDCSKCAFYKPSLTNRLMALFVNRHKDCHNCQYIQGVLNDIKKDIKPPVAETYKDVYDGKVFVSPYHGENELKGNEMIAKFISDKLNKTVYLLPRLDPKNIKEASLREKLLPPDVKKDKNPDFYIGGKLFDGKDMTGIKTGDKEKYHNDILNRIKSAKKQADNIVLDIPRFVTRKTISQTINGYLAQSSKKRIIIVKHGRKCYIYRKDGA